MYKKLVLIFLCVLLLPTCGKSSDSSEDLFSKWIRDDHQIAIDLTGYNFGMFGMGFLFSNGGICATTINLTGDQKSGSVTIFEQVYVPGTGTGNPGCGGLPPILSYEKSGSNMTLCDSSGCANYFHGGGDGGAGKSVDDMNCSDAEFPLRCAKNNYCCPSGLPYTCGDYCYSSAEWAVSNCRTAYNYCY